MSAVMTSASTSASGGVWGAAWKRFKSDKVGLVSLGIVGAFLLLIIAAGLGLVAFMLAIGFSIAQSHFEARSQAFLEEVSATAAATWMARSPGTVKSLTRSPPAARAPKR